MLRSGSATAKRRPTTILTMDRDEEEGLRAFALKAGAASHDQPLWVTLDGATRVDVSAIEAAWREEERLGFRVRLADGAAWLLYYVPELDIWSGVEFATRVHERIARRRITSQGESPGR